MHTQWHPWSNTGTRVFTLSLRYIHMQYICTPKQPQINKDINACIYGTCAQLQNYLSYYYSKWHCESSHHFSALTPCRLCFSYLIYRWKLINVSGFEHSYTEAEKLNFTAGVLNLGSMEVSEGQIKKNLYSLYFCIKLLYLC